MSGSIRPFIAGLVAASEGNTLSRKDEKALEGAYAVGQTDLDGGMVVRTEGDIVVKGVAPWSRSTPRQ